MPIRGPKPFMPKPPRPESGIFSSNGRQKVDSTADFPYKGVKTVAVTVNQPVKPRKRDNRIRGG
jgi:hypothetical protein